MIVEHIIITACCCLKIVTWNAKSAWAVRMEDFELHGHQHINVYITHYFHNNNNNNNNNNNIITTNDFHKTRILLLQQPLIVNHLNLFFS